MTKQSFLHGAIILILAGLFTRFLGFINRIVVARLIGEEGVGIYMLAIPTLILMLTLSQIGLPVAIAKYVAEADVKKDEVKIRNILTISFIIIGTLSVLIAIILFMIAPTLSKLLSDERTFLPILFICPIIPIVGSSAIIKGYFQGKQNMKPQSYAVVIEQIIRIIFVAIFIKLLLPFGLEYAAAGAMLSVLLGEISSLCYLYYKFKKDRVKIRNEWIRKKPSKIIIPELFSIALPTTGSRVISSLSAFIEPIIIVQCMAIAGFTTIATTKLYGELTGFVMPLLLLPTFISFSLSIALVPSISEAETLNHQRTSHHRIHQAIRISFASGGLATILFITYPEHILNLMYGKANASYLLKFMSPFFIFLYIQAPLQAALQALNLAKQAMYNAIFGVFTKLIILIILTSQSNFGIMGVAIAISTSVILVTILHLVTLYKSIQFKVAIRDILQMIILLGITYLCARLFKNYFLFGTIYTFILSLLLLTIIYILLLFFLKFITKNELKQIPLFTKWFNL